MYDLGGRAVVALIAILAVGLVALPSTVSLFAGQHYWYAISGGGSQIPCEKCHADVYVELNNNPYHENLECEHCHRGVNLSKLPKGMQSYSSNYGEGIYPGIGAHAASPVSCLICHSGKKSEVPSWSEAWNHSHYEYTCSNDVCHTPSPTFFPPVAGGFGVTGQPDDTGIYAAHRKFVLEARNESTMMSANEACIACHTHVAVKIKWEHKRSLEFDLSLGNPLTVSTGAHNWTISNWNVNGTATAYVWGNTTGNGSTTYSANYWPGEVPGNIYE